MPFFLLGDFVRRKSHSPWKLDPFQCHPASFGRVIDIVVEDCQSRSDNPRLGVYGTEKWVEVVIKPFDKRMAPYEKPTIQWSPNECIRIGRVEYMLMIFLWPLLRLLYREPLRGQSTNYG